MKLTYKNPKNDQIDYSANELFRKNYIKLYIITNTINCTKKQLFQTE